MAFNPRMKQKHHAFVAGATGYVGREVVRSLCARGVKTVAHLRPGSSERERWRGDFAAMGATVDETAWDTEAMARTLATLRPSLVFALLGTTRKRAKSEQIDGDAYDKIDFGLTAMLFDAAALADDGDGPRFIYLSTAGLSERSSSPYMRARWKAEKMIEAGYVIARPAIITGGDRDDSRPGERIAGGVADAALSVLGALGAKRLRSRYQSTTNTTLASALTRLALDVGATAMIADGDDLR